MRFLAILNVKCTSLNPATAMRSLPCLVNFSFSWPAKGGEEKGKGLDKLGDIAAFKYFLQVFEGKRSKATVDKLLNNARLYRTSLSYCGYPIDRVHVMYVNHFYEVKGRHRLEPRQKSTGCGSTIDKETNSVLNEQIMNE